MLMNRDWLKKMWCVCVYIYIYLKQCDILYIIYIYIYIKWNFTQSLKRRNISISNNIDGHRNITLSEVSQAKKTSTM